MVENGEIVRCPIPIAHGGPRKAAPVGSAPVASAPGRRRARHPLSMLLGRAAVLLAVVAVASLWVPGVALAHDQLIWSSPANDATVDSAPERVVFQFSADITSRIATATVTGADGSRWDAGAATVEGAEVRVAVRTPAPAGAYTAAYRIVGSDGHPITGSITYTVKAGEPLAEAPSAAPQPLPLDAEPEAAPAPQPAPVRRGAGLVWPWVLGGLVLAGVAIIVVRRAGRGGPG
jgi:copper resistance protein C